MEGGGVFSNLLTSAGDFTVISVLVSSGGGERYPSNTYQHDTEYNLYSQNLDYKIFLIIVLNTLNDFPFFVIPLSI